MAIQWARVKSCGRVVGVSKNQSQKANTTGSKLPYVSFSIENQAKNIAINVKKTAEAIPMRLHKNDESSLIL